MPLAVCLTVSLPTSVTTTATTTIAAAAEVAIQRMRLNNGSIPSEVGLRAWADSTTSQIALRSRSGVATRPPAAEATRSGYRRASR